MSHEKDSSINEVGEGTRVDLGDDLLQDLESTTAATQETSLESTLARTLQKQSISNHLQAEEAFENAKILIQEGLTDDAKKLLRQILVFDSNDLQAKQALQGLQDAEIKQILGEGEARKVPHYRTSFLETPVEDDFNLDSEWLMRKLDSDLKLGIFDRAGDTTLDSSLIFEDAEAQAIFLADLEKQLVGAALQDWIDMGIAFLEMEFYSIAIHLFQEVIKRDIPPEGTSMSEACIAANVLLALSFLKSGKALEATSNLQPLLWDSEFPKSYRAELLYMMGRAYEALSRPESALYFYRQVMNLEPHYRDIDWRLNKK